MGWGGHGWNHHFEDVRGEAMFKVNLKEKEFSLRYYPPRIEEFEERGCYSVEANLGEQEPAVVEILRVDAFKLSVGTEHA